MLREEIKKILQAILPGQDIFVDYVPKDKKGDYSTNLALRLAARNGQKPQKIADEIAAQVKNPMISEVIVYAPGFVNFVIDQGYLLKSLAAEKPMPDLGKDTKVLVEFVSANPTGPINIVSARAAAFGDSLVRLLNAVSYKAEAEYYVNDSGQQIDLLTESIAQRIRELQGQKAEIPEHGYHGTYLIDVARNAMAKGYVGPDQIKQFAVNHFIGNHKQALDNFGVHFDNWIFESAIREHGSVEKVLQHLNDKNLTFQQDGAVYFKSTAYTDNRDRVIITSDQRYTYLLPDIAYHLNKINRGYKKLVTVLGPDHIGQVHSLTSGLQAFGYPAEILKVIIVQEVKLKKDGKIVAMSKRAGTFTALDDMLEKIPKDVARFFFLMRSCSQHLDFDIDLALKESEENPVYYVQYALARIKSIIAFAREKGIESSENTALAAIKEQEEFILIKQILRFPETIEDAVRNLDPYPVTYYLIDLARIFHNFYQKHRVVSDDQALTHARLYLIQRTMQTLKTGLELLGVSCPDRM